VLFSGAQASGKTTSAAAYIAARLALYGGHCVTYEHPVEMPLAGPHGDSGWCYQREIASEADLPAHIERTHRYGSPDIILIGEIRTQYAAAEALRVALGSRRQIVVATIHGQDVISALSRLLTWARSSYGDVACQNLSEVLTAIIHQDIVFTAGEPLLKVPESLLLPYTRRKENSACVKLWQGNLSLEQEIMSNRNDLLFSQGDFRIKQPSDDK
jgi:twitching motility protein PilT